MTNWSAPLALLRLACVSMALIAGAAAVIFLADWLILPHLPELATAQMLL
jgi:hypothetical protein